MTLPNMAPFLDKDPVTQMFLINKGAP